jgi:hypothetical protein
MRDHKGEFVLVIGSSNDQPHCLEFSNSPENRDKMVVSIDTFFIKSDNNFNIDFNNEESWKILHAFNGRFRTIIFDLAVDDKVSGIDIIDHIKQLLIVGGKMYKYYSRGVTNIPMSIISKSKVITEEFTESYRGIIKYQCQNIPPESIQKLGAITFIKFLNTPYGKLGFGLSLESFGVTSIDEFDTKNNWSFKDDSVRWRTINDITGRNILWYIRSLYNFFDNLTYTNLLQKLYNFDTEFFSDCINYPLKNPSNIGLNRFTTDMCFVVCTKK